MQPPSEPDLELRIRDLLAKRQKMTAVKLYREETGTSLLDAKNAVEAIEGGASMPVREILVDGEREGELLRLLGAGKKIQAVKLYRELNGGGLKEAKEAVEALGERHGIVGRGGGCLGMLVLAIVALLTAATLANS